MKKIILSLIILLSTYSYSQNLKDFEGLWTSGDTNFITVFTHNDIEDSLSVYTFSFKSNHTVSEIITKTNDSIVSTQTLNKKNGWKVTTDYKLLTKQTMIASFDGDTNVKCLYYKANFNVE